MRLLDMDIEPFLIRSAVVGLVAQRLVRKLCPMCKEEYSPPAEIKDMLRKAVNVTGDITLAMPKGCNHCLNTGYSGRTAIYEMIPMNEEIRHLILKSPSEARINEVATKYGRKSLRQSGIYKALEKLTTLEEVMHITTGEGE